MKSKKAELRPREITLTFSSRNFVAWQKKLDLNYAFLALPESGNSSDRPVPAKDLFQIASTTHLQLSNIKSSTIESNFSQEDETQTVLFFVKTQLLNQYQRRPLGYINSTFWRPQDTPLLALNRSSWDEHQNFPFVGTSTGPKRVGLIINNHDDGAHAFHLHGHNFYVLSSFQATDRYDVPGSYNPYRPNEGPLRGWVNYKNPLRKDTVVVPSMGYVWVTFMADNPGLWLLHCHMMVHQAAGMAAGFHVGTEDDHEHVQGQETAALQLCNSK